MKTVGNVIYGAGVYLIIGLYALGFETANKAVYDSAKTQAARDQAREIANAGVRFAIGDVGSNKVAPYPSGNVSLMNGSVAYTGDHPASLPSSQMRIVSTGTYNGHSVIEEAILEYNNTKWITKRIHEIQSVAEYTRLSQGL